MTDLWEDIKVLAQAAGESMVIDAVARLHCLSDLGGCEHCSGQREYTVRWPCDTLQTVIDAQRGIFLEEVPS